jgi:SAM-dependent methyltransferase
MNPEKDYLNINRENWNQRTPIHWDSEFYSNDAFIAGANPLNDIELTLLGDVQGKSILHLQCHFGQDSIALSRLGAKVTGIDLSDQAIGKARELAAICNTDTAFVVSDVYDLPNQLTGQFDMVFTSYGTIGWLPDLSRWASVIHHFLKPGGTFIMADFHPVVWMFDDDLKQITYRYFNGEAIVEKDSTTYGNPQAEFKSTSVGWNHGMAEIIGSLLKQNLHLLHFDEFDYSPYNCFKHMEKIAERKYRIQHFEDKIPMVYALVAQKKG